MQPKTLTWLEYKGKINVRILEKFMYIQSQLKSRIRCFPDFITTTPGDFTTDNHSALN